MNGLQPSEAQSGREVSEAVAGPIVWGWSSVPALPVDPVLVPTSWSGLPGDAAAQMIVDLTMRSLLRPGAQGWTPDLATSYDYDAKSRTIVVHLDGSATWSDGTSVTGADVVATFGAARKNAKSPFHGAAAALTDPGGLSVAEDGSVHLVFRPDVAVGASFTLLATMAIAPAAGAKLDDSGRETASGTLVARTATDGSLTLFAASHASGAASAPIARFVSLPEGARTVDVGKTLDVAPIPAASWNALPGAPPSLKLLKRAVGSVAMLVFNTRPRVGAPELGAAARDGLAAALDSGTVAEAAGPNSVPAALPLPVLGEGEASLRAALHVSAPSVAGGSEAAEAMRGAAQALDAAGWPKGDDGQRTLDGAPVMLSLAYVAGDPQEADVAKAISQAWQALGVNVSLQPLAADDFAKQVYLQHAFDAAIVLWQPTDPFDPSPLYSAGSRFNASGWTDAAAETAMRAAVATSDWKARQAALATWWQEAGPARAYVPLYAPATTFVARSDLEGTDLSRSDLGFLKWRVGSK